MASPTLLQDSWSAGMRQDVPREQLPKGAAWSIVDMIPDLGAPLAKRGGWSRPFDPLTGGTYLTGVGFAPFTGGVEVLSFRDDGRLWSATPGSATMTDRGAAVAPAHPPVFYRDHAIITGAVLGGAPFAYIGGGSFTNMNVGSITASVACAYKDMVLLGRSGSDTRLIYFSGSGDITDWDSTDPGGRWLKATFPVFGLAALRNLVIVFGEGATERLVGSIPPGISGSDMRLEPLHSIGCADPAAIATDLDYAVFANADGIYQSDGIAVADLTLEGGIKNLWQTLLSGYTTTWTIAGTIHRGDYLVTVLDGSTFKCAFRCDVKRRAFTRLSNLPGIMLASSPVGIPNAPPSVYMADRSSLYLGNLATMYTPSGTYKNDGNSTAVTPTLELGHFYGRLGRKRWREITLSYYMTDAATDNPVLAGSYSKDLAVGAYTAMTKTWTETTVRRRLGRRFNGGGGVAAEGLSLKFAQSNASAVTNIYSVEAEMLTSEPSRS